MQMEVRDIMTLTVESALSLLIFTLSYKIYIMKIKSHSGCCLKENNGVTLDKQNSGVSNEDDVLDNL